MNDSYLTETLKNINEGVLVLKGDEVVFTNSAYKNLFSIQELKLPQKAFNIIRSTEILDFLNQEQNETYIQLYYPSIQYLRVKKINQDNFTILIFEDRTEFKKLLEEEEIFLLSVAHELKTPLTSLFLNLEILEEQSLTNLEPLKDGLVKLKRILEGIFDLQKIKFMEKAFKEKISVDQIIQEAIDYFQDDILEKSLKLILDMAENELDYYKEHMRIIVKNLLDNAIKYSYPGGRIWISFFKKDRELILEIKDEGIGIEPTKMNYLLKGMVTSERGLGVGLYLVNNILKLTGSKIFIESEEKKGTNIKIMFPTV